MICWGPSKVGNSSLSFSDFIINVYIVLSFFHVLACSWNLIIRFFIFVFLPLSWPSSLMRIMCRCFPFQITCTPQLQKETDLINALWCGDVHPWVWCIVKVFKEKESYAGARVHVCEVHDTKMQPKIVIHTLIPLLFLFFCFHSAVFVHRSIRPSTVVLGPFEPICTYKTTMSFFFRVSCFFFLSLYDCCDGVV